MEAWILVSLLLVLGAIMILFTRRISGLMNRAGLNIFKIAPWLNLSGKDVSLDEWKKSRLHVVETIWVWGMRVIGVIFVIGSILVIYALTNQH